MHSDGIDFTVLPTRLNGYSAVISTKGTTSKMRTEPGTHLFFDLDGTISDPELGITRSIQHALRTLNREAPIRENLRFAIGPPLRQTFRSLLKSTDESEIETAVSLYRERFSTIGLFENSLYDDVPEVLSSLVEAGYCIMLVTAKPYPYAIRIIKHFGLMHNFTSIYGSELSGRFDDKGELIAHILHTETLNASSCIMVGDRVHDVRAAHCNGVRAVGALWGFGTREELADAEFLCERPEDLPAVLSGLA